LESELKTRAEQLGIADRVEFAGFIDEADKPRYLASADIMAFPSSGGESFGIVLIEAMAAVRPGAKRPGPIVLAGDNPGYRSVMAPKPELLFKPGDAQELAEKLLQYLQDVDSANKIRSWQSAYVQQFDTAIVGRRLLSRYTEVLRKRRQA
jgi:phosphatidylinositol alpha-mannosyltransferase